MNKEGVSFVKVSDDVYGGGQPARHDLEQAKAMGIKTIINLRDPNEKGFDLAEQNHAAELGLRYVSVVVDGPEGLTEASLEAFVEIAAQDNHLPFMVHCRTGERAGAMLSLFFRCHRGLGVDESLALGQKVGLDRLRSLAQERMDEFVPRPNGV
ncbi:MAG: hypothetical protein IPJ88_06590 [Myxococcales bacterium]|nr:MAG: hypothetical protein IPJ88_06590 [Myxococcales bacterium]